MGIQSREHGDGFLKADVVYQVKAEGRFAGCDDDLLQPFRRRMPQKEQLHPVVHRDGGQEDQGAAVVGHQAADHNRGDADRRHGEQPPDRELGILHAFSCLSTQVSFLKQHLDGVSLFVDSCKGSFVTNDGEVPDIPSDYSK